MRNLVLVAALGAANAGAVELNKGNFKAEVKDSGLCGEYDVKGYPTIKYFTAESDAKGTDYSGGRTFDDLKSFVSETLEVKCLLADPSGCSDKEKDFMGKWKEKDKADVSAQLERLNKMVGGTMAPDLKKWVAQRLNILKQLADA